MFSQIDVYYLLVTYHATYYSWTKLHSNLGIPLHHAHHRLTISNSKYMKQNMQHRPILRLSGLNREHVVQTSMSPPA